MIAAQLHTVRDRLHDRHQPVEVPGRLREIGYQGVESAPGDTLRAELDTYWLQAAGASPATWLRKLKGRVPLVHLKDMTVVDGRAAQTEVGNGNLDWPEILSACREAGAEWLIVEQDETERDPIESLTVSYRNLADLLR